MALTWTQAQVKIRLIKGPRASHSSCPLSCPALGVQVHGDRNPGQQAVGFPLQHPNCTRDHGWKVCVQEHSRGARGRGFKESLKDKGPWGSEWQVARGPPSFSKTNMNWSLHPLFPSLSTNAEAQGSRSSSAGADSGPSAQGSPFPSRLESKPGERIWRPRHLAFSACLSLSSAQ